MSSTRNFPDSSNYFPPGNVKCVNIVLAILQYVQIDDEMSSLQTMKSGIPQGSIVGPLFFSIYINDIVKCTDKFNCILYADDTTVNSIIDSFGQEPYNETYIYRITELMQMAGFLSTPLKYSKIKIHALPYGTKNGAKITIQTLWVVNRTSE